MILSINANKKESIEQNNVKFANDFSNEILKSLKNLGENYKQKICANLDQRFTNEFAEIAEIDNVLKERPENASFFEVSKIKDEKIAKR